MTTVPSQNTDRVAADISSPLAVTVQRACELSGLGPTTIWTFLKDGRLEAVRVPGLRRTLGSYSSLVRFLSPPSNAEAAPNRPATPEASKPDGFGKMRQKMKTRQPR